MLMLSEFMEPPAPTALSSLIQRGIKSQRRQLQEHVILRGERFVCLQCEEEHAPHSGWAGPVLNTDNVLGHFKTKHKNVTIYTSEQFVNARKRLLEHLQPTISSKFPKVECLKGVDQAVQLLRRHPGTPLSNFDSSDFLRPWADSKGVNRKAVNRAVVIADAEQFARLKVHCERQLIGGQADGGKDVLSDKLIGQAVVIKGRFYCWNILKPPAGTYYNAEFYQEVFEEFVDDIEACDALMCGLTVDNEASLNAGISLMLRNPDYQHLIHNRCTNHSAELLLSDVQDHIPLLQSCTDACHDIVTVVRNTKAFKDALRKSQLDSNVTRPMRLIKPANTRKWSTSFLMLSRVQQLYAHLARLDECFAPNEAPAQRGWRETWAPRLRDQVPPAVPKVQRGTILQDRFKLREYWMSVWSEVPALFMVFLTLNSVCATEAGCERIFSKEGFIHNDNRNRLGHDLVVALMRNAVNADDFNGILNAQHMWDFDDLWLDLDEDDEDEAVE